jgi:bacillolysin
MKRGFVILGIILMHHVLFAQNMGQRIRQFRDQTGASVSLNRATGVPGFIRFPFNRPMVLPATSSAQASQTFLRIYGDMLSVPNYEQDLTLIETKTDPEGYHHLIYLQSKHGIPVFGGILKFHFDRNNQLRSVNGVTIPDPELNTTPTLSAQEAATRAVTLVAGQVGQINPPLFSAGEKLFVFRKGLVQGIEGPTHLVYEVEVGNGREVREFVYLDAHTGKVVEQFTGTHSILHRKLYQQNTSNLIWEEGDGFPGSLNIWQQNEINAAGHMYYFFKNAFGFDSYNNAGAEMKTIHENPDIACPNANWNGMTTNYCDETASDDVVAHEWAHAYTDYTSNLIYAWQSGALNESYSDIWGETIDLLNGYEDAEENLALRTGCGSSERWRIGEDASAFGGAIRDMWDPTCKGNPGKVSDPHYHCYDSDAGGVHTNSGVNNHAYALLVDGGTYNGQTITGLGFTKAAHIFWRAQRVYLTATSDFSVQADALEASCTDLIGIDLEGLSTTATPAGPSGEIITAANLIELQKVLAAVEMRMDPPCAFTPLLNDLAYLCPESLPDAAIYHEDFENGLGDWTVTQIPSNPGTWEAREWELTTHLPDQRDGTGIFAPNPVNGDCQTNLQNGILRLESPVIGIPSEATTAIHLAFWHYLSTEYQWDGGNLKYSLNDGAWQLVPASAFEVNPYNISLKTVLSGNDNPLAGQAAFSGSDQGSSSGSWGRSVINLSLLGIATGSTLQLRWELGTDGCNGRIGWYLDDITIFNCHPCRDSLSVATIRNNQQLLLETAMKLTSTDTLNGNSDIIYQAGQALDFQPGFEVSSGSSMEAKIDGCTVYFGKNRKIPAWLGEDDQLIIRHTDLLVFLKPEISDSRLISLEIPDENGTFAGPIPAEWDQRSALIIFPLTQPLRKGVYQVKLDYGYQREILEVEIR